jgi:hypothetical protein
MTRRALLIGNTLYNDQTAFSKLYAPERDVQALKKTLKEHCGFQIDSVLINRNDSEIRLDFRQKAKWLAPLRHQPLSGSICLCKQKLPLSRLTD